ncbi:MAG: phosphoenolpyruvate synthase, partial [Spirochaetales bacterium]|nr:phosphoenolpyruvate synthase [Spirochaetales bacterium]
SVTGAEEALEKLESQQYDLVITTMRTGEITPFALSRIIKDRYPDIPILLLLTVSSDIELVDRNRDRLDCISNVFLWNGDSKLFLAMVKSVEDLWNVAYDTENGLVRVILLVEDSIPFQSVYLPLLYTEVMEQTQRLIYEELNNNNKYQRMRSRPKVLVASSYEKAMELYDRYKDYLICLISDVRFWKENRLDEKAGIKLVECIKKDNTGIPVILQSSDNNAAEEAERMEVAFFNKNSPSLLQDLRTFIMHNLGFGDFVFRNDNHEEIARAHSLSDFLRFLPAIPVESLLYHSERNHFSSWLIAHGEFQIARVLRPIQASDFESTDAYRHHLISVFKDIYVNKSRGKIISFDKDAQKLDDVIIQIGGGSLGGKGRGLAFFNALLVNTGLGTAFPGMKIRVPKTLILGADEFDHLVNKNNLHTYRNCSSDMEIREAFVSARLSEEVVRQLTLFLRSTEVPLAVRSSSLLEDSQSKPFAGVYQTYMLPNNEPDISSRLRQLTDAIKLVCASVFLHEARSYIQSLNYIVEEEKMAVVIQEMAGSRHGDYFYPHVSGVAQSYNYYPVSPVQHNDGAAYIALGLGQSVVDGGKAYGFCPRYPKLLSQSVEDLARSSQTEFYAIDMRSYEINLKNGEYETLGKLSLDAAERHGTLTHLASVWDHRDQRLVEGLSLPGQRVLNFPSILKYDEIPLAAIITEILDTSEKAMGVPVEIEFALKLKDEEDDLPVFYLLQVRPLAFGIEDTEIIDTENQGGAVLLYASESMGNGYIDWIYDIVFIPPDRFDSRYTEEMRSELDGINQEMLKQRRPYILLGPGRWGSRDRFLGIPVSWSQISQAKVIVEYGLEGFDIAPSQGTHFFHNISAMNIGYFTVPFASRKKSFIDWDTLKNENTQRLGDFFYRYSTDEPLMVKMDGRKGVAFIYKQRMP